jgi:hypothetical protein
MTAVSTTPEAPIATSAAASDLRAVKLSERIRYLHCEGGHGVMTFIGRNGSPQFVKEIASREDFKLNYSVFRMMEDMI